MISIKHIEYNIQLNGANEFLFHCLVTRFASTDIAIIDAMHELFVAFTLC